MLFSSLHFRFIRFSSCLITNITTQFPFNRFFRTYLSFCRNSSHYPKTKGFNKGFFINNYKPYLEQSTNNPNKSSQIKSTRFNIAAYPDSMPRILNVAEKPDAARTISQILSHGNSNRVRVIQLSFFIHANFNWCWSTNTPDFRPKNSVLLRNRGR